MSTITSGIGSSDLNKQINDYFLQVAKLNPVMAKRQLEVEAYASCLTAFKVQGELSWKKESILHELRQILKISDERHRIELARIDETFSTTPSRFLLHSANVAEMKTMQKRKSGESDDEKDLLEEDLGVSSKKSKSLKVFQATPVESNPVTIKISGSKNKQQPQTKPSHQESAPTPQADISTSPRKKPTASQQSSASSSSSSSSSSSHTVQQHQGQHSHNSQQVSQQHFQNSPNQAPSSMQSSGGGHSVSHLVGVPMSQSTAPSSYSPTHFGTLMTNESLSGHAQGGHPSYSGAVHQQGYPQSYPQNYVQNYPQNSNSGYGAQQAYFQNFQGQQQAYPQQNFQNFQTYPNQAQQNFGAPNKPPSNLNPRMFE